MIQGFFLMIIPFAVMVILGLALPLLAWVSYYRFEYGLIFILFIWMMEAFFMGVSGFHLGIFIYYNDLVLFFIATIASLRFLVAKNLPRRNWVWVLFCLVICVSLSTGLVSYGTTAGVQARGYFYFMASALYAMSFPMDEKRVRFVLNALVFCALVLVGLCIYRWVVYYTPIYSLLPKGGVYNIDGPMRVIRSMEALLIAQVFVAGIFFTAAAQGLTVAKFLSPFLLGSIIALQHRSVWLAAILGILSRFVILRSARGSSFSQLSMLVLVMALTALPMMISDKFSEVGGDAATSAARGLSGEGTVQERANSWKEIIRKWYSAGPRSILIGQSFGTDNTRYVPDSTNGGFRKIDYTAHNMYVQTLFNTGLLGLGAFLAVNFFVVSGLYRLSRRGQGGVVGDVLLVLIIMQLVYYVPYGDDYLQSLLFGIALSFLVCKLRENKALEKLC